MTMRALVLLACLLVSCTARADHTKDAIDVEVVNGGRKLHESKYTPGSIAMTLADAWANLITAKANYKYNKNQTLPTNVLPTSVPAPSKSKTFAYTNIRLSSQATGTPTPTPTPPPSGLLDSIAGNPLVTQDVPVSGARAQDVPVSGARPVVVPPLTTNTAAAGATATAGTAATTSDIDAKLAELQAQLAQIQSLEEEIKALKTGAATRKLLDSGLPGWDSGVLLQKKLDILAKQASMLQDKLSTEATNLQTKMMDMASNEASKMSSVADFASNTMYENQNAMQATWDAWKEAAETNAGNLQDMLGQLMDYKEQLFEQKLQWI